jgi:hypothetical protein
MINECTHNVLADLLTYFLHKCNDALKVRVYDYTPLKTVCLGSLGAQKSIDLCLKRPSYKLLDSLLQEVCINVCWDRSLTLSSLGIECLS